MNKEERSVKARALEIEMRMIKAIAAVAALADRWPRSSSEQKVPDAGTQRHARLDCRIQAERR